jgi:hypothetical protein
MSPFNTTSTTIIKHGSLEKAERAVPKAMPYDKVI